VPGQNTSVLRAFSAGQNGQDALITLALKTEQIETHLPDFGGTLAQNRTDRFTPRVELRKMKMKFLPLLQLRRRLILPPIAAPLLDVHKEHVDMF
jgi:hypothetical protein